MNKIVAFKRIDDGEIFSINENGTYSSQFMKEFFPGHLHQEHTKERLSELTRYFEPIRKGERDE